MNEEIGEKLSREAAHEAEDPRFKPNMAAILAVVILSWLITLGALLYAWNDSEQDAERGVSFAAQVEEACSDDVIDTEAITRLCEGAKDVVDESDVELVEGPQGKQGIPGAEGPEGPQGPVGPRGFTGDQGPRGFRGPEGPVGPAGIDGTDGIDGIDGTDGTKGEKGDTGLTGETGPAGPKGEKGDKGDTGEPGPAGADGAPGAAGTPGDPGRGISSVGCDQETEQFVITYTDGTTQPVEGSDCVAPGPGPLG